VAKFLAVFAKAIKTSANFARNVLLESKTASLQADFAKAVSIRLWIKSTSGGLNMSINGLCPKCIEITQLTRHHIFPLRHYPRQRKPVCLYLCRNCHSDLERKIPFKKMARDFYVAVVKNFLTGGNYATRSSVRKLQPDTVLFQGETYQGL